MPASPEPRPAEPSSAGAGRDTDERELGLHRFVIHWIGNAVAAGRLPPGHQIVPEELAAQLGVSRPVIREALRVLQAKGMLIARPRLGTRVRPAEHWNLLDRDVIGWRVHGPDRDVQLRELLDLRLAIEPSAAGNGCAAASEEDVAQLLGHCERMEQATRRGDLKLFTAADIDFHTRLLHASGNMLYRQFATPIAAVLEARHDLGLMPKRVDSLVVANHRAITEAIREHDAARAESLTRALIKEAGAEIDAALSRPSSSA